MKKKSMCRHLQVQSAATCKDPAPECNSPSRLSMQHLLAQTRLGTFISPRQMSWQLFGISSMGECALRLH